MPVQSNSTENPLANKVAVPGEPNAPLNVQDWLRTHGFRFAYSEGDYLLPAEALNALFNELQAEHVESSGYIKEMNALRARIDALSASATGSTTGTAQDPGSNG